MPYPKTGRGPFLSRFRMCRGLQLRVPRSFPRIGLLIGWEVCQRKRRDQTYRNVFILENADARILGTHPTRIMCGSNTGGWEPSNRTAAMRPVPSAAV